MMLDLFDRPAMLFLPASRAGAIAKARESEADIAILDLEDAVKDESKAAARESAVAAVELAWPMPVAIRVNSIGTVWYEDDVAAVRNAQCDFVVLPRAESAEAVAALGEATGKPVAAMIETPRGVLAAAEIAVRAAGLIVGTNDLRASLGLAFSFDRSPISSSLQMAVLAARAEGIVVFDGVYNRLDDPEGLTAEAVEGRTYGFDGKSLIHPDQIAACRKAFAPTEQEVEHAERLISAATGGAERFEGQMIESMHVAAARRLLDRRA
jgi:citrate lyase subunit beta/citryl-CoA lyase